MMFPCRFLALLYLSSTLNVIHAFFFALYDPCFPFSFLCWPLRVWFLSCFLGVFSLCRTVMKQYSVSLDVVLPLKKREANQPGRQLRKIWQRKRDGCAKTQRETGNQIRQREGMKG